MVSTRNFDLKGSEVKLYFSRLHQLSFVGPEDLKKNLK